MTVDEAIKMLQSEKTGGIKNIVLAYWTADQFGRIDDATWAHDAEVVEDKMDWSDAHDTMQDLLAMCDEEETHD